jgi:hypothetical protein
MESKDSDKSIVSRTCPNCYYPLPRFGKYCSHCGQKYTDGRITVASLVRDFLADTLNLDSKIWRTLAALLVPGKLTKEFFEGKQQRYIKPVRLFFVFAILTVAAVSFFEAEFTEGFFFLGDDDLSAEVNYVDFLHHTNALADTLRLNHPDQSADLLDSLQQRLRQGVRDSVDLGVRILDTEQGLEAESRTIAKTDLANMSVDSLMAAYQVENFIERLIFRQNIRLLLRGENFAPYMLSKSVWMMLLLMPLLAVLLKLLYVRRAYYYVEHLIFSFHTHAFLFLVLIVLMLLDNVPTLAPTMGKLWLGGLALVEIYFLLALRTVYKQSGIKTLIKFLLLNFFYFVLFLVSFILTVILAALFY